MCEAMLQFNFAFIDMQTADTVHTKYLTCRSPGYIVPLCPQKSSCWNEPVIMYVTVSNPLWGWSGKPAGFLTLNSSNIKKGSNWRSYKSFKLYKRKILNVLTYFTSSYTSSHSSSNTFSLFNRQYLLYNFSGFTHLDNAATAAQQSI